MGTVSNLSKESTSYFVIKDEHLYGLEKKLIAFSGLKLREVEFHNI